MDQDTGVSLIQSYVEGWREGNRPKILSTPDPECVIIECYGPVYRGVARVRQWIDTWFGEGNTVDRWEITSMLVGDSGSAFEWLFECTWHGSHYAFEGASIVQFRNNKIARLREYRTTDPLYEWEGQWRS